MWIRSLSPERRALLFGTQLAVTLHAFDELSVVTALPIIADDLAGRELYGAVFFAYLLASIVGLVSAGWLATRYGPARPFAGGLAVFLAGLVAAALAPDMPVLLLSRALQGLGGGVIATVVLVVVNRAFEPDERPHVMALTSAAWVIPALIAPGVAGAVAEYVGWRWVFAGLTPFVFAAAALALPAMRHLGPGRVQGSGLAQLADGARLAAGVGMLLTALGWDAGPVSAALALGGVVLAVGPARRLLPDGILLARTGLAAAVGFKLLLVFAFFGTESFVPLGLREVHALPVSVAGLILTTAALMWSAGAFLQARLAANTDPRILAAGGALALLAGVIGCLFLLDPATSPWFGFAAWAVAGLGMGVAYTTAAVRAMAHTSDGDEGATSTALGVADALGISISTGVGGALIAFGQRAGQPTAEPLGLTWGIMACIALIAVVAALSLREGASLSAERPELVPAD